MYFFWKLGDPFPILSPKHGEFHPLAHSCPTESRICCLTFILELLLCYLNSAVETVEVVLATEGLLCFESEDRWTDRNGWAYLELFALVFFQCHRKASGQ